MFLFLIFSLSLIIINLCIITTVIVKGINYIVAVVETSSDTYYLRNTRECVERIESLIMRHWVGQLVYDDRFDPLYIKQREGRNNEKG